MTLQPYDAKRLDHLALSLLDLAAIARDMSTLCSEHGIEAFTLHDKKALQWWGSLERWLRRARAELQVQAIEARATHPPGASARRAKR